MQKVDDCVDAVSMQAVSSVIVKADDSVSVLCCTNFIQTLDNNISCITLPLLHPSAVLTIHSIML